LNTFSQQWFDAKGLPNRFHLMGGSKHFDDLGKRIFATRESWAFVDRINYFNLTGTQRLRLNGETTAHEFTHAWDVNDPNNSGHCVMKTQFNDPSKKCLMVVGNEWATGGSIYPEFYDGVVALHFDALSPGSSEYMGVRRHAEPLQ
jgi:hypothetical protein